MSPVDQRGAGGPAKQRAIRLTRWELASGSVIGADRVTPPLRLDALTDRTGNEREALAAAILPALLKSPCTVSFSGGLDSSVVLAVAVRVAREHGLPDPVPVTLRFPGAPAAEESRWQELTVSHLGLKDWERIERRDELDFIGELAADGLRRHGLLWPANAHFHVPVFERAAGGAVLTGLDGDGLFGGWRWQRSRSVLARTRGPEPRDVVRIALMASPHWLRTGRFLWRMPPHAPWLRPAAARRVRALLAIEAAKEPTQWEPRLAWYARRRYLRLGVHSLAVLASCHEVEVVHPLLDRGFLAALAAKGGRSGFGDRRQAVRALFGDLLPRELLDRRTKGEFGATMWGERSRAFARAWDGRGVDLTLVDPDRLRSSWLDANPPLGAATLIQMAWLASRGN